MRREDAKCACARMAQALEIAALDGRTRRAVRLCRDFPLPMCRPRRQRADRRLLQRVRAGRAVPPHRGGADAATRRLSPAGQGVQHLLHRHRRGQRNLPDRRTEVREDESRDVLRRRSHAGADAAVLPPSAFGARVLLPHQGRLSRTRGQRADAADADALPGRAGRRLPAPLRQGLQPLRLALLAHAALPLPVQLLLGAVRLRQETGQSAGVPP
mmetsp:Transcript_15541/g.59069  ORF Transcript_15541/g.59069 Transcript_15541/m.59069 type:complete len:214 (+) Transcript_15541:122-763(+)